MDILFWTQCSPSITVEHTTKKYFGKYLYKIIVYAPAGRLIDSKGTMANELEHRISITRNINQPGWWGARQNKDLENADVNFLEALREIRKNPNGIKLRVEEPRVQIYAATEDELISLVFDNFGTFRRYIETVTGPADAEAEAILNSGAIIRKTSTGYTHKVILRDGRYTPDIKLGLLNYLTSIGGDTVHIADSLIAMLTGRSGYIWNAYFYTNDPSVTMFLNLMHPNLVLNIHELVVLPHK